MIAFCRCRRRVLQDGMIWLVGAYFRSIRPYHSLNLLFFLAHLSRIWNSAEMDWFGRIDGWMDSAGWKDGWIWKGGWTDGWIDIDGLWSKRTHAKTYPTKTYRVLVKTYPVHQNVPKLLVKTYPIYFSLIFNIYFYFLSKKSYLHIGLERNIPNIYFRENFWYSSMILC